MEKISLWRVATILSVVGIILASYLFYNFFTKPQIESCYINSVINCDAVTKGSLSTILGVPVSLVGLIGYVVILFSSIFKKRKTILGMSSFGMIFCLFITFQEIVLLRVVCPVCLSCQVVMFLVFMLSLIINMSKKKKK